MVLEPEIQGGSIPHGAEPAPLTFTPDPGPRTRIAHIPVADVNHALTPHDRASLQSTWLALVVLAKSGSVLCPERHKFACFPTRKQLVLLYLHATERRRWKSTSFKLLNKPPESTPPGIDNRKWLDSESTPLVLTEPLQGERSIKFNSQALSSVAVAREQRGYLLAVFRGAVSGRRTLEKGRTRKL